jgi:hypothetical protein
MASTSRTDDRRAARGTRLTPPAHPRSARRHVAQRTRARPAPRGWRRAGAQLPIHAREMHVDRVRRNPQVRGNARLFLILETAESRTRARTAPAHSSRAARLLRRTQRVPKGSPVRRRSRWGVHGRGDDVGETVGVGARIHRYRLGCGCDVPSVTVQFRNRRAHARSGHACYLLRALTGDERAQNTCSCGDSEFRHDQTQVRLDRVSAEAHRACDLLVGQAEGQQVHEFHLPLAQVKVGREARYGRVIRARTFNQKQRRRAQRRRRLCRQRNGSTHISTASRTQYAHHAGPSAR